MQHDPAILEHIAAVSHLQGLVGVLFHQKYRHTLIANRADDLENLRDDQRRQPQRRLIKQQQPWPRHQGAADGQHLLFAA